MAKQYDISKRPRETDRAYYVRLAKVADQRLVRLEGLSYEKGFRSVKDWAYAGAMKNIARYKEGATRFNIKINDKYLQDAITDVKHFLERPTSSKQQIVKYYKKRAETISSKQGVSYTWKQLADFFENKKYEKAFLYASGDTLRVYNAIRDGKLTVGDKDATDKLTGKSLSDYQNEHLVKALSENTNKADQKTALEQIIHVDKKQLKSALIDLLINDKIDPKEVFGD